MKIAIIGAGFAGIASAKVLRQLGHDVTVYEKAPDVGGVWSRTRRYPGLCTQNNKGTYHLSDLPMPDSYPEWPSGEQVQSYIEGYAAMFGLAPHLRLSTEVVSAELDESDPATPRWTVRTRPTGATTERFPSEGQPGEEGEQVEEFDHLVVANGIFCEPNIPTYPGVEEFVAAGGQVVAPSEVTSLDDVRDKKIAVIGYGKSACDVAVSLSEAAESTTVIARNLLWKMPRMLAGVLNYKFLMLTRLGEGLFEYQKLKGIEKLMHGRGKPVVKNMLGSVQQVATKQLKLEPLGLVPDGDFERIARSTVSLVTEGFYQKAAKGELRVIRDAQIVRLGVQDGKTIAELSTRETVELDMVVCATGFRQEVPFLSDDLQDRITDERGNFELYRQILPHDVPGLTFCGYNSSFFSPLSAEVAAIWTGALLMGDLELPPLAERRAGVQERLRWMEERTENHHARGTNIIPFSMHNIDEMLDELGLNLPGPKLAQQWLLPPDGRDYSTLPERLIAKHEARTGERVGLVESEMGLTPKKSAKGVKA